MKENSEKARKTIQDDLIILKVEIERQKVVTVASKTQDLQTSLESMIVSADYNKEVLTVVTAENTVNLLTKLKPLYKKEDEENKAKEKLVLYENEKINFDKAEKDLQNLNEILIDAQRKVNELTEKLKKTKVELEKAKTDKNGSEIGRLELEIQNLNNSIEEAKQALNNANKNYNNHNYFVQNERKKVKSIITDLVNKVSQLEGSYFEIIFKDIAILFKSARQEEREVRDLLLINRDFIIGFKERILILKREIINLINEEDIKIKEAEIKVETSNYDKEVAKNNRLLTDFQENKDKLVEKRKEMIEFIKQFESKFHDDKVSQEEVKLASPEILPLAEKMKDDADKLNSFDVARKEYYVNQLKLMDMQICELDKDKQVADLTKEISSLDEEIGKLKEMSKKNAWLYVIISVGLCVAFLFGYWLWTKNGKEIKGELIDERLNV